MKNIGIYAIIINGLKVYIGSSKNLHKRKLRHLSNLKQNKHGNSYLQHAWDKYGEDKFEFKIIKYCKEEQLLEWEQHYINFYNSTNPNCGYNLTLTANCSKLTSEVIEKISKANMKYLHLAEEWQKLRQTGLSYTDIGRIYKVSHTTVTQYLDKFYPESKEEKALKLKETRVKLSTGYKHTEDAMIKLKLINLGRKHTDETKKHMSESAKGRVFSKEHKERIGQANRKRVYKNKYKEFISEWKELYLQGLNYTEIGKKYNTNQVTVSRYLRKYYPGQVKGYVEAEKI